MGRRVTRTTGSGAYVLADVLRTDRARLRPLIPDSPATIMLRQACYFLRQFGDLGQGRPAQVAPVQDRR
jgi:hypothetical protein